MCAPLWSASRRRRGQWDAAASCMRRAVTPSMQCRRAVEGVPARAPWRFTGSEVVQGCAGYSGEARVRTDAIEAWCTRAIHSQSVCTNGTRRGAPAGSQSLYVRGLTHGVGVHARHAKFRKLLFWLRYDARDHDAVRARRAAPAPSFRRGGEFTAPVCQATAVRAPRRRIRQAVAWHRAGFALGEGLPRGVDAATLHLQATQQRERPWAAADAAEAAAHVNANGRQRRSNERAAENRARRAKAEAIRLRNVFSTWHQQLEHPNVRG